MSPVLRNGGGQVRDGRGEPRVGLGRAGPRQQRLERVGDDVGVGGELAAGDADFPSRTKKMGSSVVGPEAGAAAPVAPAAPAGAAAPDAAAPWPAAGVEAPGAAGGPTATGSDGALGPQAASPTAANASAASAANERWWRGGAAIHRPEVMLRRYQSGGQPMST